MRTIERLESINFGEILLKYLQLTKSKTHVDIFNKHCPSSREDIVVDSFSEERSAIRGSRLHFSRTCKDESSKHISVKINDYYKKTHFLASSCPNAYPT